MCKGNPAVIKVFKNFCSTSVKESVSPLENGFSVAEKSDIDPTMRLCLTASALKAAHLEVHFGGPLTDSSQIVWELKIGRAIEEEVSLLRNCGAGASVGLTSGCFKFSFWEGNEALSYHCHEESISGIYRHTKTYPMVPIFPRTDGTTHFRLKISSLHVSYWFSRIIGVQGMQIGVMHWFLNYKMLSTTCFLKDNWMWLAI